MGYIFNNREELKKAVDLWCVDEKKCLKLHYYKSSYLVSPLES